MRIALAQLAPVLGDLPANVASIERVVRAARAELAVFPELFLTGYRAGDEFHRLGLSESSTELARLSATSRRAHCGVVTGGPRRSKERRGEVENVAYLLSGDRPPAVQVKRYLPTYGPFEEGATFSPGSSSDPLPFAGHHLGLSICYDAFFPEVNRELAVKGADLLVAISASPVTSRRLFERVLPARAIENAVPLVYVNRVGVEDGLVFGGGSAAYDARGEPIEGTAVAVRGLSRDESVVTVEVDLEAARRWRPFRPVLRDVTSRPPDAGLSTRPRPL